MPTSNRLFVTGGVAQSQKQRFYELELSANKTSYKTKDLGQMAWERDFHSMCYIDESRWAISGSRAVNARYKVEVYNIDSQTWESKADLVRGRSRHSSCGFRENMLFIFCGWFMDGGERTDSIIHLDLNGAESQWQDVEVSSFEKRMVMGCL